MLSDQFRRKLLTRLIITANPRDMQKFYRKVFIWQKKNVQWAQKANSKLPGILCLFIPTYMPNQLVLYHFKNCSVIPVYKNARSVFDTILSRE